MILTRSAASLSVLSALALWFSVATTPASAGLFVSNSGGHNVLEYNGTSGAFVTAFVSAGSGGLSGPNGLVFGPNEGGREKREVVKTEAHESHLPCRRAEQARDVDA
jgi:hypothetical protein